MTIIENTGYKSFIIIFENRMLIKSTTPKIKKYHINVIVHLAINKRGNGIVFQNEIVLETINATAQFIYNHTSL